MPDNVVIVTLGCRLNVADTALLTSRLEAAGYRVVPDTTAEVAAVVINSCTVTAEAAAKSRKAVRRFRRQYPKAVIAVTGCAAELGGNGLKEAGADLVTPNAGKRELADMLKSAAVRQLPLSRQLPPVNFIEKASGSFPFRSRAFIKIQEGCDNRCTYCIVPTVRGPARSRNLEEVLQDCRTAVRAGFPELVLTGVNTCAYSDAGCNLSGLIEQIAAIPGTFRIRLSSTEPHPGDTSLLEIMASTPKVCRFLHLSLQYGNDRILRAMNRHYSASDYADFVQTARRLIPGIHIGSDLIVGFPGESDTDFAECSQLVGEIGFANLHIFTYSPRPSTPAAALPGRPAPETVKTRFESLRSLAATGARRFAESQRGKTLPVIFERSVNGVARGWSDNYLEVYAPESEVRLGVITPYIYR